MLTGSQGLCETYKSYRMGKVSQPLMARLVLTPRTQAQLFHGTQEAQCWPMTHSGAQESVVISFKIRGKIIVAPKVRY